MLSSTRLGFAGIFRHLLISRGPKSRRQIPKNSFFGFLVLFCAFFPSLGASFPSLKEEDIRPTMQEILSFHVESRIITPQIMQRVLKNFLSRYDPDKIYLKESEVNLFVLLNSQELKEMVKQYEEDDFATFVALNQIIQHSIERSRAYREEILREIILQKGELTLPPQETHVHYAKSERELKRRLKNELVRVLIQYQKRVSAETPDQKEKILNFFLKKISRSEELYTEKEGEFHQLVVHTLKAMAQSLDAHTAYFTPEEAFELKSTLEKEFEGVGVVLKDDVEGVMIANLVKGGPAERSGKISSGDRLYKINTLIADEHTYDEILQEMKQGSKVTLDVIHIDGSEDKVTLKKERIELTDERVKYSYAPFGDGVIGKIELPSFYGNSGGQSSSEKDMIQAIRELKKRGNLIGLVIDLRENLGGFLSEAVKVASLFVKSGVIVVSKYARGEVQFLRDIDPRVYYDGPLIILTSQASASAAEIVAQALQDYGIALIAGDKRTYGKGSIQYQTITDPGAKRFFKVTVGRYYTVSGRSTQINGVKADIIVPTQYSLLKMGERYLDYPLSPDHIDPSFVDPLLDIQDGSQRWFQKYYLPNLQKRISYWRQMIPYLEKNSQQRIATSPDYQLFLQTLKKEPTRGNWGKEDLQMAEALEILRDMIVLHREKVAAQS